MKIALHYSKGSFSDYWIEYCETSSINYKIVNCYQSDIIEQIADCDVFMWHFHHASSKDLLFAKQLLYSAQSSGKRVFPDFNTAWHFDDKLGQKYLLEAIGAPIVPSWVFYSKSDAIQWATKTTFPKVFKLRGGAGSVNVQLVKTKRDANYLIKRAFGKGFNHDSLIPFKELVDKYIQGKITLFAIAKRLIRFAIPSEFSKTYGKVRGYIYFQDFIPNNDYDIRVIVIGDKAFAIKRMVRQDDFRASGSGNILYEKEHFDDNTILLSFELADKLKSQCVAFDFVYQDGKPQVVEISYGFSPEGYEACVGYWDKNMTWNKGKFNPYGWMVDNLIHNDTK